MLRLIIITVVILQTYPNAFAASFGDVLICVE